jgi:hypothetical protein
MELTGITQSLHQTAITRPLFPDGTLYQVSDNLTHVGDSRIGVGLIQHGKQLSEVCHGRPYPASP